METTFKALTKIIKNHKNILIMTHKNIDLDAFGSSLACSYMIESLKRKSSILLNKKELNLSVKKAMKLLNNDNFISKSKLKDENFDLLIILDTSKKELLEDESMLNKINDIVVIDHHVVTNRNINDTKISYINSNLSSTNEFMAGYIKYLNRRIPSNIATIMLAGIEIDTNFYRVKTTSSTFNASASLLLMGASSIDKHDLLKEEKEDYLRRVKYLENSYMVGFNSICVVSEEIPKEELSLISERMMMFEGVRAAFTIGLTCDKMISISARSLGDINVFEVMQIFGGGGHLTEAAAQIDNSTIKQVEKELVRILR